MKTDMRNYAASIYSYWAQGTYLYVKWAMQKGVSYYEMLVFYALDARGSMTQKAISEYYGLPKQTINNVIRSLKKENYIVLVANEKDKREKMLTLTERGKVYSDEMLKSLFEMEERVCKRIGSEKLSQMIETSELFNLLFENELGRKV